jgi:hypothetical protein
MESSGLEAEELTLRSFVIESRRNRLASVVWTKKRYLELVGWLAHGHPWDPRWATRLAVADQQPDAVERILKAHGAPDRCHVLGGSSEMDGKNFGLRDALDLVVGCSMGVLVICVPGQLAYHEGEERHDRNVLHRPGGR